ncbi:hypothetical protein PUN28_008857 [Cardiocondyla obscurior]|uniref:Uncharacterized protein n=1 Tax=Cardiocondyla obscurior TaxID=286306 RepID=A0AAW2FUC3_9HYME
MSCYTRESAFSEDGSPWFYRRRRYILSEVEQQSSVNQRLLDIHNSTSLQSTRYLEKSRFTLIIIIITQFPFDRRADFVTLTVSLLQITFAYVYARKIRQPVRTSV